MVKKDEIDKNESDANETSILSISFVSKKSIGAGNLTSNVKKGDPAAKTDNKATKSFKYLTLDAKKPLISYGRHLYKCLPFNILIWNGISGLKPMRQAMLLVKF